MIPPRAGSCVWRERSGNAAFSFHLFFLQVKLFVTHTTNFRMSQRHFMILVRCKLFACLSAAGLPGQNGSWWSKLLCVLLQAYESLPRRWSLWCTIRISLTNDRLPPQHNPAFGESQSRWPVITLYDWWEPTNYVYPFVYIYNRSGASKIWRKK